MLCFCLATHTHVQIPRGRGQLAAACIPRASALFFFFFSRKGRGQGELLTDPIRFFCCVCCVLCCDEWCVRQPHGKVLSAAVVAGNLDEVKAAVDAGAPMEWANPEKGGKRAVHIASALGHNSVVAFLGSRGADVNAVEDAQATSLHYAAQQGHAPVCTTLLALGADPAAKTKTGKTALDIARKKNETECVAVLEAKAKAKATEAAKAAMKAAIAKACTVQFKLGQADEALMVGTRLRVPKHGKGIYVRFETSRFGGNNHYVRFDSARKPKKVALKKLKPEDWAVLAPAQQTIEQAAAAAGIQVSASFCFVLRACEASRHGGKPVTFTFLVQNVLSCCPFRLPLFLGETHTLACLSVCTPAQVQTSARMKNCSAAPQLPGAMAACGRMNSARQPSLLLLSGKGERPGRTAH
eukprot:COSAG06_NODE_2550_length_6687_cov_4.096843_1_plen_411_part_00